MKTKDLRTILKALRVLSQLGDKIEVKSCRRIIKIIEGKDDELLRDDP